MAIHYEKYLLSRIISVQAIVSADYIKGSHPATSNHAHQEAWELVLCLRGNLLVDHNEGTFTLKQDQLILIQPGVYHDLQIDCENGKTFVLSFTCTNDNYLLSLQNKVLRASVSMLGLIDAMIRELKGAFGPQERMHLFHFIPDAHSPLGAEQMICCYLEQFLILLLRDATMEQGSIVSSYHFRKAFQAYLTDQVTDYIRENISGQLSVQSIADHFHYSRARLSALYKEATGNSISDAIANAQILYAKQLLQNDGMSITQVSEILGFSSPQYFSCKFTKIAGITPSQYCQKRKS